MTFSKLAALAAIALLPASGAFATADEIEAARKTWTELFSAGDSAAVADTVFADDAILLPPDGPMIEGRDAIAAFWQGLFDAGVTGLELDTHSIDVVGDTGIVTGIWTVTVPTESGGTTQVSGKEMLVYKKSAEGAWLASRDIWNDGK